MSVLWNRRPGVFPSVFSALSCPCMNQEEEEEFSSAQLTDSALSIRIQDTQDALFGSVSQPDWKAKDNPMLG